ncbi:hypothetical protein ACN2EN_04010 [Aliarcobacter lanthieri]|uniref:hypothetical protein n=1 Tax=Aliarcobacter lanthieri TaxID=1355374 RepID=UPI003AFB6AEE
MAGIVSSSTGLYAKYLIDKNRDKIEDSLSTFSIYTDNINLPPFEIDKNNGNLPSFDKSKEENSNIGGIEADPNVNRPNVGGVQGQEQNAGNNIVYANQSEKDAKKISSNNEANKFAQNIGYKDAHDFKESNLNGQSDKNLAHYDIYYNSKDNQIFLKHKSSGKMIQAW